MHFAFEQFATFNTKDAADNKAFAKTKLTMPIFALGADHSFGTQQAEIMRFVATTEGARSSNSGHVDQEEQPAQTVKMVTGFLAGPKTDANPANSRARASLADAHELLAEVLAFQQADERRPERFPALPRHPRDI